MPIEFQQSELESKERKLPKLNLDFFFSAHDTAEDIAGLKEAFEKADIFIPELSGWTEGALNKYRDLALGRITPEDFVKTLTKKDNGYDLALAELIYKSYKPIVFVDNRLGSNHNEIYDLTYNKRFRFKFGNSRPFESSLAEFRVHIRQQADLHKKREDEMIANLYPNIQESIKDRPDLASKKELRVLSFLGASHTRVANTLSGYGEDVHRKFRNPITVYPYFIETFRLLMSDKPVSNEVMARVLLERYLNPFLRGVVEVFSNNTNQMAAYARKVVSLLSYEEIKDVFSLPDEESATRRIGDLLDGKRVPKPKTLEELRNFLGYEI